MKNKVSALAVLTLAAVLAGCASVPASGRTRYAYVDAPCSAPGALALEPFAGEGGAARAAPAPIDPAASPGPPIAVPTRCIVPVVDQGGYGYRRGGFAYGPGSYYGPFGSGGFGYGGIGFGHWSGYRISHGSLGHFHSFHRGGRNLGAIGGHASGHLGVRHHGSGHRGGRH